VAPRGDDPAQECAPHEQVAREFIAPDQRAVEPITHHDLHEDAQEHADERCDCQRVDRPRSDADEGGH